MLCPLEVCLLYVVLCWKKKKKLIDIKIKENVTKKESSRI